MSSGRMSEDSEETDGEWSVKQVRADVCVFVVLGRDVSACDWLQVDLEAGENVFEWEVVSIGMFSFDEFKFAKPVRINSIQLLGQCKTWNPTCTLGFRYELLVSHRRRVHAVVYAVQGWHFQRRGRRCKMLAMSQKHVLGQECNSL